MRSLPSRFVLTLATTLLAACASAGRNGGDARFVDGPQILDSADLARMERGELRPTTGFGVRYTSAEWERILAEAEIVEGFDLSHGAGPVVVAVPFPPPPRPGGDWPSGPEDFGMVGFGLCPEGCTPSIGPGPDDAPGHLYCRCEPPGGGGDDDGSGTIGGGGLQPQGCALRFTSKGLRCTGSCPLGQSCRFQASLWGNPPFRAFLLRCACS